MRLIFVSIGALFISFICVLTVKFWGKSQVYTEYKHPFFTTDAKPLIFEKPSFKNLEADLNSDKNLFLDVAITRDQRLVAPKQEFTKPIRNLNYNEIKDQVLLISDFKEQLKKHKIIFNVLDSVIAVHEVFLDNMKEISFEAGDNFIVTSEYEQPVKALKELVPAWLYGSTKPEILKIVAMQSMHVLEAANIRADVVIHPLKIHNQFFFNEDLLKELAHRYKRFIVGPVTPEEIPQARALGAFAIIVAD